MPVLLRLLLCLTLLANTAGGAWAAHGLGNANAAAVAAAAPCHAHMAGMSKAMPAHANPQGHLEMAQAGTHQGCCAHSGCDCLQHCGTALGQGLLAGFALVWPIGQQPATGMSRERGLVHPYQPVRPPIA